jgi:opacity protein-like surface antigen
MTQDQQAGIPMNRLILAAVAALVPVSAAAEESGTLSFAQETLSTRAPGGWTGGYAGLGFAMGQIEDDPDDTDVRIVGLHGGYLHDVGAFVVGGEIEIGRVSDDEDLLEAGRVARFKGIAGYDAGRFLPYVTVGTSQLSFDFETGTGATVTYEDRARVLGAGVVFAATDRLRIGAEYLQDYRKDFDGLGTEIDMKTFSLRGSFVF